MTDTYPQTVDDYISTAPEQTQVKLREIRECIRKVAPDAKEVLNYGIATFAFKKMIIGYGYAAKHIGLYPTPSAMQAFAEELREYPSGKGSVQFPLHEPLPLDLIRRIAEFRVKEAKEQEKK